MSKFKRVGKAELHGRRWRVVQIAADGSREHRYFESQESAEAFVQLFRAAQGSLDVTIAQAVTEYVEHLARYGGSRRVPLKSTKVVQSKLVGMLRLTDSASRKANRGARVPKALTLLDRGIKTLTPVQAQKLYNERVRDGVSADTHRSELVYANAFGVWCVERGYLDVAPFLKVRPEGQLSQGKAQLRIDEARRFIRVCYADSHPLAGVAAAGILTLGVRANELMDRTVRDLDDGGNVLWIPKSKTMAGRRRVVVPPVLRARLQRLAEGQAPDAFLFGSMTDGTLLKAVHRLCGVAGVPEVCTHGLRGTQISLTVEIGAMVAEAGRRAGHAGVAVTRAHYMAAGTEESARAARMEALLLNDEIGRQETEMAAAEREMAELTERMRALKERAAVQVGVGTAADSEYPAPPISTLRN